MNAQTIETGGCAPPVAVDDSLNVLAVLNERVHYLQVKLRLRRAKAQRRAAQGVERGWDERSAQLCEFRLREAIRVRDAVTELFENARQYREHSEPVLFSGRHFGAKLDRSLREMRGAS